MVVTKIKNEEKTRKTRLDRALVQRGLVTTRSQAESYIRLGKVLVRGKLITKAGYFVTDSDEVKVEQGTQYVSRAGMKLESVAQRLRLDFGGKVVLDVGSSTGGFTDYALRNGAARVVAVDVGTEQMDGRLRRDPRVELYEKTDIREVDGEKLGVVPDVVLIDVSFISLRKILPHVARSLADDRTEIVAMCKPQFETGSQQKNGGVVKNDTERRRILKEFEIWVRGRFLILDKADSDVAGARGNKERFYLLKRLQK